MAVLHIFEEEKDNANWMDRMASQSAQFATFAHLPQRCSS
jgi:hypothetical protein